jgi:integrase
LLPQCIPAGATLMQLDAKTIASLALPSGKTEQFYWDETLRGFGLRLRLRGNRLHRTWVAQYRSEGRTRRPTLGSVETVLPNEARAAARKVLAKAALGGDPQGEKEAKRQAATKTFRSVVAAYLEAKASELRPSSLRVARLYLEQGFYFKSLRTAAVTSVAHADVAACLRSIERDHSTATAAAARRALSAFFAWAIAEGLMGKTPVNPVTGTRRPQDPTPRDRVLLPAELVAIWNATEDDPQECDAWRDYCRVIRLLLLLGCRASEIGDMAWVELDAGRWCLPKERSKNRREHAIVLPALALNIIRGVPQRPGREHLFGTYGDGFAQWSTMKRALDRRLGGAVKKWVVHDLRRSLATGMAEIGIAPPHIIEAALNHYGGHRRGVAGIYNRSRYDREVTAALARWSEHVLALVEGRAGNVVALHA